MVIGVDWDITVEEMQKLQEGLKEDGIDIKSIDVNRVNKSITIKTYTSLNNLQSKEA